MAAVASSWWRPCPQPLKAEQSLPRCANDEGLSRVVSSLDHQEPYEIALSGKRSLDGQHGQCPRIGLLDGFSDNKIGGRINGQKGGPWH